MAAYANENLEKFIPDTNVKEAILLKLPRPENIDPVKKLDEFLLELLKQEKKPEYHDRWYIWNNSRQDNRYYRPIIQIIGYDWKF